MYKYNDYELLYLIYEKDDIALDIMFRKYIPLIKARIKAFRIKPRNQEDFLQEGLLVLNKAIQRYNPDFKKTFTKYFDMILQRRFIQILKKESKHFYQVDLVGAGEYLVAEKKETLPDDTTDRVLASCQFSELETTVLEYLKTGYKPREIAYRLQCPVKKIYDANDRIRRKTRTAKKFLDNNDAFC
ncbi:MAG: sigma factor [Bacilli bacterium]|nr:sigma factor [Bacilli bacterium]MDD4387886.1 sigma factor [Bacilli bacterium]